MIGRAMPGVAVDQAAGLRSLMARKAARMVALVEAREPVRASVAGGLAQALARCQRSVLLIDEASSATARHFTANAQALATLQTRSPCASLGEALAGYGSSADFVLLDTLAQDDGGLSRLAAGAHDVVIVLRGDDASGAALTAAYACIKRLHALHALMRFRILLTDCDTESRAYGVYNRLATVASRYLTVALDFCGYLPAAPAAEQCGVNDNAYLNVGRSMLLWGR